MNLIQDDKTCLVLSKIEFRIGQFRPVRRQFQVKVDRAVLQFGSDCKGQSGLAYLTRPEKANRGKSGQEVLNNWLDRSLNHYLAIMPLHGTIAMFIPEKPCLRVWLVKFVDQFQPESATNSSLRLEDLLPQAVSRSGSSTRRAASPTRSPMKRLVAKFPQHREEIQPRWPTYVYLYISRITIIDWRRGGLKPRL
jgi:hypothetical protein